MKRWRNQVHFLAGIFEVQADFLWVVLWKQLVGDLSLCRLGAKILDCSRIAWNRFVITIVRGEVVADGACVRRVDLPQLDSVSKFLRHLVVVVVRHLPAWTRARFWFALTRPENLFLHGFYLCNFIAHLLIHFVCSCQHLSRENRHERLYLFEFIAFDSLVGCWSVFRATKSW